MLNKVGIALVLVGSLLVGPVRAEVTFDGTDDFLSSSATLQNLITASAFTVLAVAASTGTAKSTAVCSDASAVQGDDYGYINMGRMNDGADVWCVGSFNAAGSTLYPVTTAFSTGMHTLIMSLGAGTLTFYVDGVSVGSIAAPDTDANAFSVAMVGTHTFNSDYFTGRVAKVAWWNTALPVTEIVNLSSRLHDIGSTRPTASWELNTCTGTSADGVAFTDRSGNGRTLTGNNGAGNTGLGCQGDAFMSYGWGPE